MGGGLLIAGRPVDLPRQPQAGQRLGLQRGLKLHRVHIVVFDGVAGAHHLGMFKAGDGGDHGKLHIQRQAGGNAVGIALLPVQPFRFDKDMVPLTLRKPRHLVLHGGAVARARAFNDASEQRRAIHT